MTRAQAISTLGLPHRARWTCYSHEDQDRIAALTGQEPDHARADREDAEHIRARYTRPDFRQLHAMNPAGKTLREWLQSELDHERRSVACHHRMSRRDVELSKFRQLRLEAALAELQ